MLDEIKFLMFYLTKSQKTILLGTILALIFVLIFVFEHKIKYKKSLTVFIVITSLILFYNIYNTNDINLEDYNFIDYQTVENKVVEKIDIKYHFTPTGEKLIKIETKETSSEISEDDLYQLKTNKFYIIKDKDLHVIPLDATININKKTVHENYVQYSGYINTKNTPKIKLKKNIEIKFGKKYKISKNRKDTMLYIFNKRNGE